jgi:hypothetical protein
MSFCSGFATVCLVAELTEYRYTKWVSEHKAEVPGLKILIDIIRTSLKEAAARLKMFQSNCYDDFKSMM